MLRGLLVVFGAFFLLAGIVHAITPDPELLAKFEAEERQYQLPTGILGKIANAESRGRACVPNLAGRSSALGLFQFITSTWLDATRSLYGSARHPDLRCNRFVATEVAAWALGRFRGNNLSLIRQSGANEMAALYLSHFLGHGGGRRFLQLLTSNPDDSAARWFPAEAGSNPEAFNGRTIRGLHNWSADKMRQPGITGTDFTGTYDGPTTGRIIDSAGTTGLSRPYTGPLPPPTNAYSYPNTFTNADLNPPAQPLQPLSATATPSVSRSGQQSDALILIQPQFPKQGTSVLVSWTSAGMQDCTVASNQQGTFATGKEGTRQWTAQSGTHEFKLACRRPGGTNFEMTGSITVP